MIYKSKKLLELAKKILGEWLHQSLSFQKSNARHSKAHIIDSLTLEKKKMKYNEIEKAHSPSYFLIIFGIVSREDKFKIKLFIVIEIKYMHW